MINRKHKYNDKISLYLQLMFLFFVFLFLLNRIQYGIDFTDESWYVAEPYVVAQGWSIPLNIKHRSELDQFGLITILSCFFV